MDAYLRPLVTLRLPKGIIDEFLPVEVDHDSDSITVLVSPEQWTALKNWLATGPTLCIYDGGAEFEHLHQIDALMGFEPAAGGRHTNDGEEHQSDQESSAEAALCGVRWGSGHSGARR